MSAVRWTRDKDGKRHAKLLGVDLLVEPFGDDFDWTADNSAWPNYGVGCVPTLALAKRCAVAVAKVLGKRGRAK